MQVFITGATGFIGRALVARLLKEGHEVRAYVRSPERARALLGPRPSYVVALGGALGGPHSHATPDVPDSERNGMRRAAIRAGLSGADAVIHLAGESVASLWTVKKRERILAGRAGLGAQIIEAMGQIGTGPKVFIGASAVGIYGDRADEPLDEQSLLGETFLARVCRQTEGEIERARPLGARVVRARFGVVLGRGGGLLDKLLPLHRRGLGARLGSGRQYLSWIDREDAIEVLVRALTDARLDGPVNVVAPTPVTQAEFAAALGEAVGCPVVLRVPRWAIRVALGAMSSLVLDSQRVIPARLGEIGFAFRHSTLAASLRDNLAPETETGAAGELTPPFPEGRSRAP